MEESKKLVATCQPDYEREYHRLMAENDILRKTIIEMCKNLFVKGGDD